MVKGTRITVTVYGTVQAGTVTRTGGNGEIVFVVMDHDKATQRERWFHRCSVEIAA
jgi:cytochrome c-type biogenesis protein CcmE